MKILIYHFLLIAASSLAMRAQIDSTLFNTVPDVKNQKDAGLNMDAVYRRPFLDLGKFPVSIGGYLEANWQHIGSNGISDGHQFQFRRLTVFMASTIAARIKFLSELEFEDGGEEIAIEFAAIDMELDPLLNLRGGIILNPIGAFNQNHDGPKWEFTDRPVAMTQMLPATWSNAGFGLYGKYYTDDWMFGYEAYLSGGFDNSIIDNEQNRTYLPASKDNSERFEEIESGEPFVTGKISLRHISVGEIGLSYMGGAYNRHIDDGSMIDDKRRLDIFAVDFNTTIEATSTGLTGEWAWVAVNIPPTYTQQFGSRQQGGFLDIVQPFFSGQMLDWPAAVINAALRLEYVDWNIGKFNETGDNIGDELWSIMPGVSFRPVPQTVVRLNYRYIAQRDILDNPPFYTGGFILGVSTYF